MNPPSIVPEHSDILKSRCLSEQGFREQRLTRKQRNGIRDTVKQYTDNVGIQTFNGASGDSVVEMLNILASFYPEKKTRILLCAHWDCRPWADKDPDSAKHSEPVPGANDGASGVAVLLETAAVIANSEPEVGVDMVFFDGEDGGSYGSDELWLLGSKHFAKVMPESFSSKSGNTARYDRRQFPRSCRRNEFHERRSRTVGTGGETLQGTWNTDKRRSDVRP